MITNCHLKLTCDSRTLISGGVATLSAVALLATLVTLTALQQFPPNTYAIAGGSSLSILLIGGLIATVRRKGIPSDISEEGPISNEANKLDLQPKTKEVPPIEEIISKASKVIVNPNAHKSFPPTELYPFVTTHFTFTLTADNCDYSYNLSVCYFMENGEDITAECVSNGQIFTLRVDVIQGRKYDRSSIGWTIKQNSVSELNEQIQLQDYFSFIDARYRLGYLQPTNDEGWYFNTQSNREGYVFQVPGLETVQHENMKLTFTRNVSKPLIHPAQIELLKNSKQEWHQKMALQLENPIWHYKTKKPIDSVHVEDQKVTVRLTKILS